MGIRRWGGRSWGGGRASAPPCTRGRKHGLSTEQFPVSAYAGSTNNRPPLPRRSAATTRVSAHRELTVASTIRILLPHWLGTEYVSPKVDHLQCK